MKSTSQKTETTLKQIGAGRQIAICGAMIATAFAISGITGLSLSTQFRGFLPTVTQLAIGVALCLAALANGLFGYWFAARRAVVQHTVESYSRLDLSGWNPVLIASAAGLGEEILFRGVLQPLLGIWVSSGLFVLAHARAYRFNGLNRRILVQAGGIFGVSLAFALVARYVGLWPAIAFHIAIDIAGLYTVRLIAAKQFWHTNSFKGTAGPQSE